jgi:platelet-activating factor acetylhydrolase
MDAPVATKLPESESESESATTMQDPCRFPVIVFSHGLGGCRTTYSGICGEFASHGFVVCAIEHRDGTASVTSLDKGKRTMPYRRPKQDEDEYRMRRGQIHHRLGEIHSAWELLERLNSGNAVDNCLEEITATATATATSTSLATLNDDNANNDSVTPNRFDQKQLKNRLDLDRAVMAGHSFGAATTIEALREPDMPYKCGVILDAWMFAVSKEVKPIPPPIVAINSQAFTRWNENYSVLRDHMMHWHDKQRENNATKHRDDNHHHHTLERGIYGPSWLFTIRDSGHQNQSDFPILFQRLMRHVPNFGGKCDPIEALEVNNRVCLEFLRRILLDQDLPIEPLHIPVDDHIFTDDLSQHPHLLLLHRLDSVVSQDEKDMLGAEDTAITVKRPVERPKISLKAKSHKITAASSQ